MKNKIVFLLVIFILISNFYNVFAQKQVILNEDLMNLKKLDLPLNLQVLMFTEYMMKYYDNSFKYINEIRIGQYKLTRYKSSASDQFYLEILDTKGITIDKINVPFKISKENKIELTFENFDFKKFTLPVNSYPFERKNSSVIGDATLIIRDSIIADRIILNNENIDPKYRHILNRSFTRHYIVNQDNNEFDLYRNCIAGRIVPFGDGDSSKIITIDNEYHSLIFFDKRVAYTSNTPVNGVFGRYGEGKGQFMNPTCLTIGREFESDEYLVFPVYIADQYNLRIIRVDFWVNQLNPVVSFFNGDSFTSINDTVNFPYDVSYFKSSSLTFTDKLWASETSEIKPTLRCFELNGSTVQKVVGYKDSATGVVYPFEEGTHSRLAIYNNYFTALSFVDNMRNVLVSCKLKPDGTATIERYDAYDYVIEAHDLLRFPSDYKINSVSFQKTSALSSGWPYVWVTSGQNPPFTSSVSAMHLLKMNSRAHTQYIGSTETPFNSESAFTNLLNTMVTDDFFDLYTIEDWNDSYGIRKYYPFASIHSDTLFNYCSDSVDQMKFKGVFTNDCFVKLTAERKEGDTWQAVKFRNVTNAQYTDENFTAIKFQLAGWNRADKDLYIDIKLDLPLKDYALGGKVRLHMKIFPEYINPFTSNTDYSSRNYEIEIKKSCLPKPGGCPFLYVKDENYNYVPDNNLLHRMEFSEPSVNITDKYKLRIAPQINNNQFELYLVENENDFAFIDQVKVYAVDYSSNKKMGITEDNKIVIFDSVSVLASDSVILGDLNITSNVNYFNPSSNLTNGFVNDSLYAHFSYPDKKNIKKYIQNSEMKSTNNNREKRAKSIETTKNIPAVNLPIGFITNLRNLATPNQTIKDTAGYLTATSIFSNTVSKVFARRELESVVILPLFNDTDRVDHLNIKWQSDFRMKYLGIATLDYTNYVINGVNLKEGLLIDTIQENPITSYLTEIDGNYCELNSSGFIKMSFEQSGLPSLPEDYKREYVIEVTGNYINGDSRTSSKKAIDELPLKFSLSQNYPNPFNPTTKINYELPRNAQVNLVIYDILGREVIRLVNNDFKQAGRYTVEFNGQNFASGVYFYRIEAGTFVQAKKMVLIK